MPDTTQDCMMLVGRKLGHRQPEVRSKITAGIGTVLQADFVSLRWSGSSRRYLLGQPWYLPFAD